MNGRPAKAAQTVRVGDRILCRFLGREVSVDVQGLTARRSVSKVEARTLYSVVEEKRFDIWGREIIREKK